MYTPDEQDTVHVLTDVPNPETGAPDPVVMADDHKLLLAYYVAGPPGPNFLADEVALVSFKGAKAHMFGLPNDEVLQGHPLASRGLKSYQLHRVDNSSWIRSLERINSVHDNHSKETFMKDLKHYIFTFHDSTFECVAEGFEKKLYECDMSAMRTRMVDVLQEA